MTTPPLPPPSPFGCVRPRPCEQKLWRRSRDPNANPNRDWKPGPTGAGTVSGGGDADEEGESPAWKTLHSVFLGTWERRPLVTSPKDRNKLLDNAAAFVRACFPAQVGAAGAASRGNGGKCTGKNMDGIVMGLGAVRREEQSVPPGRSS